MDYVAVAVSWARWRCGCARRTPPPGWSRSARCSMAGEHYYMGEDWGLRAAPRDKGARISGQTCARYSNLLLERGQGSYGFIHLTFEERLAAYGLVPEGPTRPEDSLAIIQEHLTDPAWRETILLAVGVWGWSASSRGWPAKWCGPC